MMQWNELPRWMIEGGKILLSELANKTSLVIAFSISPQHPSSLAWITSLAPSIEVKVHPIFPLGSFFPKIILPTNYSYIMSSTKFTFSVFLNAEHNFGETVSVSCTALELRKSPPLNTTIWTHLDTEANVNTLVKWKGN